MSTYTQLRLKYTNEAGAHVNLGNEAPLFFLYQEGMDGTEATPIMAKSPGQYGQTQTGLNIEERDVTIYGALVTESADEEEEYRRKLVSVFSPLVKGDIEVQGTTYSRMFSNVQVVDGPNFEDTEYEQDGYLLNFNVSFVVPGNFMEDIEETELLLMQVVPSFAFELCFEEPIEFGNITVDGVHITNNGDAPMPLQIEIPGPVDTPSITNETTGEFIKVKTPILASEVMLIDTRFGHVSVVIHSDDGSQRNAFHYIDLNSTFFQLQPGENFLRFSAEVENDTANTTIRYKKLYLGI